MLNNVQKSKKIAKVSKKGKGVLKILDFLYKISGLWSCCRLCLAPKNELLLSILNCFHPLNLLLKNAQLRIQYPNIQATSMAKMKLLYTQVWKASNTIENIQLSIAHPFQHRRLNLMQCTLMVVSLRFHSPMHNSTFLQDILSDSLCHLHLIHIWVRFSGNISLFKRSIFLPR